MSVAVGTHFETTSRDSASACSILYLPFFRGTDERRHHQHGASCRPHMALLSVLSALAAVAYSHPTPDRSLLFGSTPSDGSSSAPPATPTVDPSTPWSPHTAPATCAAGVDTSPSCPYDSVGDNIKICPTEFPTFTPSNETAAICEIAVIGASPATHLLTTRTS